MIHKLEVDSIELDLGNRKLLSDVYLKCETGSVTCLLGRNGQGKSCLMNIIYGTLYTTNKSVRFDDVVIKQAFKLPDKITFLPQFNFIPVNISVILLFKFFNISIDDFINDFPEFEDKRMTAIKHLSGGQKRLIEVYLIIKSKSQFSMLDEPFSQLMPLHVEHIKQLILSEKRNKGFLITDHLFKQFATICDQIYLLKDRKTFKINSIDELSILGYINF